MEEVKPSSHQLNREGNPHSLPQDVKPAIRQWHASHLEVSRPSLSPWLASWVSNEEKVSVGHINLGEGAHKIARVAADACALPDGCRVVDSDAHLALSRVTAQRAGYLMPRYVQIRFTPKFQNSTTPMATALARL